MATTLLHYVCELMSKQMLARSSFWRVLAGVKHHIRTHCERGSIDGPRGLSRTLVCVDANVAEIVTKARFHEIASRMVEGMSGGMQPVVNYRGNVPGRTGLP